jgi:hypothetical protein
MSRPLNPWKLSGYKAGQNVVCKVGNPEPGGYAVLIPKDNLPGFLPTQANLKAGEEILAQFVCVHNNRILLSARFSTTAMQNSNQRGPSVNWEEQLSDIEGPVSYSGADFSKPGAAATASAAAAAAQQAEGEQDLAFQVWASNQIKTEQIRLRRAIDLILPALDGEVPREFKISDYDLEWLITDLEGGMRTCCVKTSNNDVLSRSAILLYRGRAVGCIYCSKSMPDPPPVEMSLQYALNDLNLPNTEVIMYDLPEGLTLSSSALFLGYPVERSDDYDARSYMDYICNWFETKGQTACLALSFPNHNGHCFGYVYRGKFVGAFYVEEQVFSKEKDYVYQLLDQNENAQLAVSILPPEMTSSAVRFGYSLSMARKVNQ